MRVRPLLLLPLALGLAACESAVEAPAELTLQTRSALEVLPADVQMVGMVDMEAVQSSAAYTLFTEGDSPMSGLDPESAARFDDFVRATGFDPEEDVRRVYFAAAREGAPPALVIYADYDRTRLDAYVSEEAEGELRRTTYADVPVYYEDDDEMAFALVNDDMIVASDRAGVEAMLDRLAGNGTGLAADADAMALIRRATYPDGMWAFIRNVEAASAERTDSPFGEAGRMVRDAVISVGFERDGLTVSAVGLTAPDADRKAVADLVRGGVAAMKISAASEPAVLDALDDVRVRETADGVTVRGFVGNDVLRTLSDYEDV